jgi:hypothetical protein
MLHITKRHRAYIKPALKHALKRAHVARAIYRHLYSYRHLYRCRPLYIALVMCVCVCVCVCVYADVCIYKCLYNIYSSCNLARLRAGFSRHKWGYNTRVTMWTRASAIYLRLVPCEARQEMTELEVILWALKLDREGKKKRFCFFRSSLYVVCIETSSCSGSSSFSSLFLTKQTPFHIFPPSFRFILYHKQPTPSFQ